MQLPDVQYLTLRFPSGAICSSVIVHIFKPSLNQGHIVTSGFPLVIIDRALAGLGGSPEDAGFVVPVDSCIVHPPGFRNNRIEAIRLPAIITKKYQKI